MVKLADVLPHPRPHGSAHWHSKLREKDIPKIKELHAQGGSVKGLARAFGVTPVTIYAVLKGISWRHVPPTALGGK